MLFTLWFSTYRPVTWNFSFSLFFTCCSTSSFRCEISSWRRRSNSRQRSRSLSRSDIVSRRVWINNNSNSLWKPLTNPLCWPPILTFSHTVRNSLPLDEALVGRLGLYQEELNTRYPQESYGLQTTYHYYSMKYFLVLWTFKANTTRMCKGELHMCEWTHTHNYLHT